MKNSQDLIDLKNNGYFKACGENSLKEKEGKRFILNDVDIAVFKIENEVYAVSNVCPHQQTALIYDGCVEDGCVTCPAHGWMFDIKTGKKPTGSNGLQTYDVKIINDDVYIRADKKELKW